MFVFVFEINLFVTFRYHHGNEFIIHRFQKTKRKEKKNKKHAESREVETNQNQNPKCCQMIKTQFSSHLMEIKTNVKY